MDRPDNYSAHRGQNAGTSRVERWKAYLSSVACDTDESPR